MLPKIKIKEMKNLVLIVVFYSFFNINEANAQVYITDEYPKVWERAAHYSMAVAEEMPESLYDYKIYPEGMSFKEQQLHIVNNISFLTQFITGENKVFYDKRDTSSLNKEDIIKIMESAFNYIALIIKNTKTEEFSQKIIFKELEVSKESIYYLIRDHMTHHRGQSVVYLRLKGIDAPNYVGW